MGQTKVIREAEGSPDTQPLRRAVRRLVALIVDDSPSQRKMLKIVLKKWKFDVLEAENGLEALKICQNQQIDFILSDWVMPEMTGPELCQEIRQMSGEQYVYFILLTSKKSKEEVAIGLDSGADDFLTKPVDMGELQARLRAGQRLLNMQEDLVDKNRRISEAFDHLNQLYEGIDRDLKAAARLQQSLIPGRQSMCGPLRIGVAYQPSGHVGGDLLGYFQISDDHVAAYSIDVSGHGVSSALLTARLSNFFSSKHLHENIAVRQMEDGTFVPRDPASIALELNNRIQDEADNDQYFTMLFADINLKTGMVRFCQAGHPNPVVVRATGEIEFSGNGGPPIGLIPDMEYETEVVHIEAGDRLLLYSDGITECENDTGEMLENEGLADLISKNWDMSEHEVLYQIIAGMTEFSGKSDFDDDVSAMLVTMPVSFKS